MSTGRHQKTETWAAETVPAFIDNALELLGERLRSRDASTKDITPGTSSSGYLSAPVVKVNFVERKQPNYGLVSRFLRVTEQVNHWTNFGPIVELTEQAIANTMGLTSSHTVILCSNGTVALELLTTLHELIAGRRLRWAGSAFNFLNIDRGQLRDTRLVDCDETGLLSLEQMKLLPSNSFDGFVVTNIFGICSDFERYSRYAAESGKVMILDNAAGIGNPQKPIVPWQSLSLHHTKPFGFGEGGAMICPTEHAPLLRELISFGKGIPRHLAKFSTNAKLSDVSAAFILARLYDSPAWSPGYTEQSSRVTRLARQCGLQPLLDTHGKIAMSLPFVSSKQVSSDRLRNPHLTIGKSYSALGDSNPIARDLFERTINIPSHPDVGQLDDEAIVNTLLSIIS